MTQQIKQGTVMDYLSYKPYCLTEQDEITCHALHETGSQRKAAKMLGLAQSTVADRFKRIRREAERRGFAPDKGLASHPAIGQALTGVSRLERTDDGLIQWVKTSADKVQQFEAMRAAIDELCSELPRVEPIELQDAEREEDLLNLYILTDLHLGMYAHHEEGGANWDIKIAEAMASQAIAYLMERTPKASRAVFCNLGDLLHSDGTLPVTPLHKNVLDQDTRYHRVLRTGIRVIKRNAMRMLEKYEHVTLMNCQGNHDDSSSLAFQEFFSSMFEDEPRIDVIVSPLPYYSVEHGECLLGFHHGHKRKGIQLVDTFNGEFRERIGRTKRTFIHTGHLHSDNLETFSSATVERHETLAARDSHASHGGWNAGRGMQSITYHKKHMEQTRCRYQPSLFAENC